MAKTKKFDDIAVFFEYGIDIATKTIYIGSEEVSDGVESGVDAKLAEKSIKGLHILDNLTTEGNINIIINGEGGDYYNAIAIYTAIKGCKTPTTAFVYGSAMSAHSIIFQAAQERVMSKHSKQMIHYGTFGIESHTKIVKSWAKESEKIDTEMEDIYLERINYKLPNFSRKDLQKLLNFDSILDSSKCLQLNLVDKVI